MIKSFRGNNLTELDKEVNAFLERYMNAKVVNFQAVNSGSSVSKIMYIYIVEFGETAACSIEETEFQKKYGL